MHGVHCVQYSIVQWYHKKHYRRRRQLEQVRVQMASDSPSNAFVSSHSFQHKYEASVHTVFTRHGDLESLTSKSRKKLLSAHLLATTWNFHTGKNFQHSMQLSFTACYLLRTTSKKSDLNSSISRQELCPLLETDTYLKPSLYNTIADKSFYSHWSYQLCSKK